MTSINTSTAKLLKFDHCVRVKREDDTNWTNEKGTEVNTALLKLN